MGPSDRSGATPTIDGLLAQLGINVSVLTPFEQFAARLKARKLFKTREENEKLDNRIRRLEMIHAGTKGLPPKTPFLLKVYEDSSKRITIVRANSDQSIADLSILVKRMIGCGHLFNIQIAPNKVIPLTGPALLDAHTGICRGELTNLEIVAL
jgi:hypothetical protein